MSTPFSVYVYPTNCCNFRCSYCAHSMSDTELKKRYDFKKGTMSMETYSKVVNQLGQFSEKIKLLSLTGVGEPLLNKNLPDMVKIAKDSNCFEKIEFISNGSLLTPEISDQLIENGLDTLRVSIQGITSKKYKKVCGVKIDFDTFMDNLRYFHENSGSSSLFVKILDIGLDKGEKEDFYNLFADCSDRMFIEKVQPTYDGVEMTSELISNYDRYGRKIDKRLVCPLPFYMLGVFPDGDVQPCDNLYRPVILGNVHKITIKEMWFSEKLQNFWKMQLRKERLKDPKCSLCCAPNDVAHPKDILDNECSVLLEKLK